MNVATLQPRRHDPPAGWPRETFDAVVSAIAAALVNAYRREHEQRVGEREPQEAVGR